MLDHIGVTVSDVARAKAFYDAALTPLGIGVMMQVTAEQTGGPAFLGYGSEGRPYFWVSGGERVTGALHVAFTDDPETATVRVQIVDDAGLADFAVIDDKRTSDAGESCSVNRDTSFVSISDHASGRDPVIFLTNEAGADYRIFVHSRTFSVRDAAALVVAAGRGMRLADRAI